MGCGAFESQQSFKLELQRQNQKSNKIDCRKKSAQPFDLFHQNINITDCLLDQSTVLFICQHLKQHSLFCTLDDKQLKQLASSMKLATAQKNNYIFKQGDNGDCFFMVKQGSVDVQIENEYIRTLTTGDCFGQIALLYSTKRTAAIKCKSDNVQLVVIRTKQFKQVMRQIRNKNNQRTKSLIDNVQIFSLLTTKQKYTLLNSLVREYFKVGTILFKKNDVPVNFYIIQSGKVNVILNNPNKKDITLGSKQSFGQNAFKPNAKRQGTVVVIEDLTCLTINSTKMKECLGGTLTNIIYHNVKKWALKTSPLFHDYQNKQLDQIALQFTTKFANDKVIIMDIDSPVDGLIICIEGKINSKSVGTLFNDEYYQHNQHLDEDLIKHGSGVYAYLSFTKLKETLQNLNNKVSVTSDRIRQSALMKQNAQKLNIGQLDYLAKLGEGQFGQVHLVKDRRSGNLFALKCLQKQKIMKQAMQSSALSERQILSNVCHPLIVGYYAAYKDRQYLYLLLEYIHGIQMFEAIRQIGLLDKPTTRFYIGSIILAIEYLHSKDIIYRDIKPQNSIVDYRGKVFLIDLGTAKLLNSDNGFRTDTIIGTPHYMAPEVMQGKGYSLQADYWSLGVLFYQLICGKLPFAEKVNNPYKVYEDVMKTKLTFPSFIRDQMAINLIKKLLNKNIQERGIGGFDSIKNSPYFHDFNWQFLYQGNIPSPYIPKKFREEPQTPTNYKSMKGYPLIQFLNPKKGKQKQVNITQEFQLWTNSIIQ